MNIPTIRTGVLAYVDTLHSGLVPCKVVRVETDKRQDGKTVAHVVAKVTAARYGYKKGETVTSQSLGNIVPRSAVKRFRGNVFASILPYVIERDMELTASQFVDGWAILADRRIVAGALSHATMKLVMQSCKTRDEALHAIATSGWK